MLTIKKTLFFSALLMIVPSMLMAVYSEAEDENSAPEKTHYKLTSSYYATDLSDSYDINLRFNNGNHTGWLGQYIDEAGFKQTRAGYEYKQDEDILRITWSAQIASHSFLGGSATAELGGDTYVIAGFGRTNLHEYYNLNFDPNDALTAGIGSRAVANTELSLFRVWDDRLNTHQQITHAVIRYKTSSNQRITLDASYKSGLSDDDIYIEGYALSVTYDYKIYFVRLAEEQYVNFTQNKMTRFSAGARF